MALSGFSFTSAAAFLVGGMASAILSAVHAQGFDMAGAHSSETLIFVEPLVVAKVDLRKRRPPASGEWNATDSQSITGSDRQR